MDYPGGPQVITLVINSAEGDRSVQVRKDRRTGAEVRVMPWEQAPPSPVDSELGGGGPPGLEWMPSLKAERSRKGFSSGTAKVDQNPANTWILAQ